MSGAGAPATTAKETEPPKETEKGEAEKEEEGEELELKPADVLKDANKLVEEGKTREAVTSVLDAMLKPLAAAKELFGISQGIACGLITKSKTPLRKSLPTCTRSGKEKCVSLRPGNSISIDRSTN